MLASARSRHAAELGGYTVPGIAESHYYTRLEGRTPNTGREQLEAFAGHQINGDLSFRSAYSSGGGTSRAGGYPAATPVAVIYKAARPESQTVRGTLADIGDKVRDAGIRKTAR